MQSKQSMPKYLVDLKGLFGFCHLARLCVFRGMPLKASPPYNGRS